jgi:hypothetical protein
LVLPAHALEHDHVCTVGPEADGGGKPADPAAHDPHATAP